MHGQGRRPQSYRCPPTNSEYLVTLSSLVYLGGTPEWCRVAIDARSIKALTGMRCLGCSTFQIHRIPRMMSIPPSFEPGSLQRAHLLSAAWDKQFRSRSKVITCSPPTLHNSIYHGFPGPMVAGMFFGRSIHAEDHSGDTLRSGIPLSHGTTKERARSLWFQRREWSKPRFSIGLSIIETDWSTEEDRRSTTRST